jgi:hypothetical protein
MIDKLKVRLLLFPLLLILLSNLQNCATMSSVAEPAPEPVQINNPPVNNPPHIIELKSNQDIITPLANCEISCIAADDDGDKVSYEWIVKKGNITGNGYKIIWTAPTVEGVYPIVVRVTDTRDGITESSINVIVKNNDVPTIDALWADVKWLEPSESCNLVCRANDLDDDMLDYQWTPLDGSVSGTGPIVVWTAGEQQGPQSIMVRVSDGYGGSVASLLTINVATDKPPVIKEFIVTADKPKFLRKYPEEYKVLRGTTCSIECVAEGSRGDLVYNWFAERGEIIGEGAIVTWIPPEVKGQVAITVSVADMAGNKVEEILVFKVEKCSCVFDSG